MTLIDEPGDDRSATNTHVAAPTTTTSLPAASVPTASLPTVDADGLTGVQQWLDEMIELLQPDAIHWIDGSAAERSQLLAESVAAGQLIPLNPEWRPGSYLARTDPGDVARVEERTFICTTLAEDAGPTNKWRSPSAMKAEMTPFMQGAMRGRTMYVVPFALGPLGGAMTRFGVQLTDSLYATLSMGIMTRVGAAVLAEMTAADEIMHGVHTVGYPLVDADGTERDDIAWPSNPTKYISHFPESLEVWSYGSGYGGNALLAKKCFALRIASTMGRRDGWLAEHMLLIKVTSPEGVARYIAAAFPSACGKTNFAMMRPTLPGWKVETFGDDIVWMRQGDDGRLWAMNPETGFFGVAPGTGEHSNPTAIHTIWGNTIFTNVALRDDGDVWWEGLTKTPPAHLTDWRGNDWSPSSGTPAAHPNSRFTAPIEQCPSLSDEWDAPDGVPIDAIIIGGRRTKDVPLVLQSFDWNHGVFLGATLASEQTAAAEGPVGALRRDPFAMLPFCGYNMGDHWTHWLETGERLGEHAPAIFQVNWFRKNDDGKFLWPGFGDNIRVVEWIFDRLAGTGEAVPTAIGDVPAPGALDLSGLDVDDAQLAELLAVDVEPFLAQANDDAEFFARFGDRLPPVMAAELDALRRRLLAAR